jgi:hypothetical protein
LGLDNNRSNTDGFAILSKEKDTRQVKIVSVNENNRSIRGYDGKSNVWILSHGWNGNLDVMNEIAKNIQNDEQFKDDIILVMDWRQAAHTGGLPNEVCRSGTWLQQLSEQTKSRLSEWGFSDPSKLKLIGHSMGTILSTEIGLRYDSKVNQSILLDPPSDPCAGGYNVNDPAGWNNETKKSNLDKSSLNSRALVGAQSLAGQQGYTRTAHKSFQMNFKSTTTNDSEHGWVQETFRNMISQTQNPTDRLQGDIIGTRDTSKHEIWERDGGGVFGWQNHNGIIYTVKKEAAVPFVRKADPMNPGDVIRMEVKIKNKIEPIKKM